MNFLNQIVCGDCFDLIPQLPDESVQAVITSPPYAMQRKNLYGGILETEYPDWFCKLMETLRPKMTADGSILVVIQAHTNKGQISDYVDRTILKVREAGWMEPDKLIWLKEDAPPLGNNKYPRRIWEPILWFSKNKPYVDSVAAGNPNSTRIGFQGSTRFGTKSTNKNSPIASVTEKTEMGTSRVATVFKANVSDIDKGIMHPAMYPVSLCVPLIETFSRPGDTILDMFVGSGTTALAARYVGRNYIGMDQSQEYVDIATKRLADDVKYIRSTASLESVLIDEDEASAG